MLKSPALLALTMTSVLALSALPMTQAKSDTPVHHHHYRYAAQSTCTTLGYEWPGFALPIVVGDPPIRARGYICLHDFKWAPHQWP
jgi:hypothetical protein